ncbi:MAG TPA: hypothetical protein VFZ34_10765 [Blastocatellia bacterium]|nr:hypothetical protein [Blastocatellia bacterium]
MPVEYLGYQVFSEEEFKQEQAQGIFNAAFSYDDYLELTRERVLRKQVAEAEAQQLGYELRSAELELTPEEEAILDQVWTNISRENFQEELAA